MDGGIEPRHTGQITDPDYRFEIYQDWKSIIREEPNYDPRNFAKNKGIPFKAIGEIVHEYDSHDPTGQHWGLNIKEKDTVNSDIAKLKTISSNLMVADVNETLEYYEALGFTTKMKSPTTGIIHWALIERNGVRLMFQSASSLKDEFPELKNQQTGGSLTLWIQIDRITEYYSGLPEIVKVIKPIGVTSYNGATEFVIQDLNGFILHFSDFDLGI